MTGVRIPSFELRRIALLAAGTLALLVMACSGSGGSDSAAGGQAGEDPTSAERPTESPTDDDVSASAVPDAGDLATTREAVLVEPGYQPPDDHVPSTGAYLPANGKPTLVFVDAIW